MITPKAREVIYSPKSRHMTPINSPSQNNFQSPKDQNNSFVNDSLSYTNIKRKDLIIEHE
jgi:hypothetical protein